MTSKANAGQEDLWNAAPGRNWARFQPDMDLLLASVSDLVLQAAQPSRDERILDVGCGAGALTFAAATGIGAGGEALGVDLSTPLIERARERARDLGLSQVRFQLADAQTCPFDSDRDLILSRFGVMFFEDPVAAFHNLLGALRPGGRLVMAAWAETEANPFFSVPGRIAVERLGRAAPGDPDAPGPMAFRNPERVVGILLRSGFAEPRAQRVAVDLFHPGGAPAVQTLLGHIGGVPRHIRDMGGTEEDLRAILSDVGEAFAPYVAPDGIRIPAVVQIYSAVKAP